MNLKWKRSLNVLQAHLPPLKFYLFVENKNHPILIMHHLNSQKIVYMSTSYFRPSDRSHGWYSLDLVWEILDKVMKSKSFHTQKNYMNAVSEHNFMAIYFYMTVYIFFLIRNNIMPKFITDCIDTHQLFSYTPR